MKRRLNVAHETVQSSFALGVPFGDALSQDAYRTNQIKAAHAGRVEDLHQDPRRDGLELAHVSALQGVVDDALNLGLGGPFEASAPSNNDSVGVFEFYRRACKRKRSGRPIAQAKRAFDNGRSTSTRDFRTRVRKRSLGGNFRERSPRGTFRQVPKILA